MFLAHRARYLFFFFFNDPATPEIYPLSPHDALPICDCRQDLATDARRLSRLADRRGRARRRVGLGRAVLRESELRRAARSANPEGPGSNPDPRGRRSEEHTSELQSPCNLVCRLLLEK